eukprot:m.271582 g.271582  ORF g.271582 m.271582 type:complete len:62 (-) comp86694_c0_seq1:39-224(-)
MATCHTCISADRADDGQCIISKHAGNHLASNKTVRDTNADKTTVTSTCCVESWQRSQEDTE